MNVDNLKVGDKIKCNENGCKYEAVIEKIELPYFYVDITRYDNYPSCAISAKIRIHKSIIVEKIMKEDEDKEEVTCRFCEFTTTRGDFKYIYNYTCPNCELKNKESIHLNISDLKVGDRVKYKVNYYPYIYEGTIIYIDNKKANVESGLVYGSQTININDIISKLEPLPLQYKEIPIEKEEKLPLPIPETIYHCPKCDEKLWGTCGIADKRYTKEPCQKCREKTIKQQYYKDFGYGEKPAPKSFKFDISFVNRIEFDQSPYKPGEFPSCFFRIDGSIIKQHPNNPKIQFLNGKEYTIEIKEKE